MELINGASLNSSILAGVRILIVDNDGDSSTLYETLFKHHGVEVKIAASIREALEILHQFVPDVLISEVRFLGESVDPLIQKVRQMACKSHKVIPIFVTSTFPAAHLAEHLEGPVEAYQIKPVDLDRFVRQVWDLALLSKMTQPLSIYAWWARLDSGMTDYFSVKVA